MNEAAKATTLADLLAAVELGALDPNTAVVPFDDIADRIRKERADAHALGKVQGANDAIAGLTGGSPETAPRIPVRTPGTPTTVAPAGQHSCVASGCAHGATHGPDYVPQRDRQTVLMAPCGARVRVTNRALALAGGVLTCGHGDAFSAVARRAYSKRGAK